jgi:hypothetical protein
MNARCKSDRAASPALTRLLAGLAIALALTLVVPLVTSAGTGDNDQPGGERTAGTGNVYVTKHGCPVGFDAYSASIGQLASTCTEAMNGIVFSLGRSLPGDWVLQATGTVFPSGVAWNGLAPGRIVITEDIPTGYGEPIVYCQEAPTGQPGDLRRVEFNPSVEVVHELLADHDFSCDWFNVPSNAGSENGAVSVNKHVCPFGVDADNADLAQLAITCREEPRDGYLFTFYRDNLPQTEQRTGDRAPGAVHFGLGEAPAQFAVQEDVPDGFGTPVVFCNQTFANGGASRAQKMDVSTANTIAFGLNAGDTVFCDWFNVPLAQTTPEGEVRVSIHIQKHDCPAGVGDDDLARLLDECRQPMDGVRFSLDRGTSDIVLLQRTGDLVSSAVAWPRLKPDSFTIQETLPEGYGAPVVYCDETRPDGTSATGGPVLVLYDLPGQIGWDLAPGATLRCDWFNVPLVEHPDREPDDEIEEDASLLVQAYQCDGQELSTHLCDRDEGGVAFVLRPVDRPGAPIDFETDTDGMVELTVPAGEWDLDQLDGRWCRATSPDANRDGNLVTRTGEESVVVVFNCESAASAKHRAAADR